jgi:rhamnose transport system permease protein
MSKMMVSEEMKNAPAAPSPLRRLLCWEGFYWRSPWRYLSATPWLPLLPQYLEPVGRHLQLYREGDHRPADGDADYRPGNRPVGGLDDGAQLNGDGLLRGGGMDTPLLVVVGLGVGLLCGLFNGFLVTRFNLSSIVITIGTMSLYRGITYILLGDQALNHYPESFAWFGQGYVWGRSL